MIQTYLIRLIDGSHLLESLKRTTTTGETIYCLINYHGGQYTVTVAQTSYVYKSTQFNKIYDNKSLHFKVSSLSSAYELVEQLIENQLF